ncbi:MAG TPA: phosphate ABC transporter permease PstA [Actinomycetes bacterium]|nr:phosphate ABC transporter permease PstA [Actinomycetes bacterium]
MLKTTGEPLRERAFKWMLWFCLAVGLVTLVVLLTYVVIKGWSRLDSRLITNMPSSVLPETAGAQSAITGTLWLMVFTAIWSLPVGIMAAIYLEEYGDPTRWYNRVIEINLLNLAAVPSIVFGILGLAFISRGMGFGPTVLTGSLTLALLVLPVVVIASREAIRAVPQSIRAGSLALGATRWQTIYRQVLPAAIPGISTGAILALSRAIGEAAPLLMLGVSFVRFNPDGLMSSFTALPVQIYSWTTEARPEYADLAAAASVVLLVILLAMNSVAIYIRNKTQKRW